MPSNVLPVSIDVLEPLHDLWQLGGPQRRNFVGGHQGDDTGHGGCVRVRVDGVRVAVKGPKVTVFMKKSKQREGKQGDDK